ncbi:UNVERIFIED_CONTAM: Trafficking protein particle complex subunit 33 [Siphonaria sp. JEL0065]|nr:Trafficking protein particle complex subunit 33 [Siphonaria sp. JEL0065]
MATTLEQQLPAALTSPQFVCDSAMDLLLIEAVAMLSSSSSSPNGSSGSTADEDREAAYFKLETLGFKVGLALTEKATRDRPRFADNLDIVKFICKDFWLAVFNKQIDNLKTNHRVSHSLFTLRSSDFCI